MSNLDALLKQIDGYVEEHIKKASVSESAALEANVLDLAPGGGKPYKESTKDEMTDESFKKDHPVEESVDPNADAELDIEEKKKREALASEKSAQLAEEILKEFQTTGQMNHAKKQAFLTNLRKNGSPYLHKVAEAVDPRYKEIKDYAQGCALAEEIIKHASYEAGMDDAMQKMASINNEYQLGAFLAEEIIKVASYEKGAEDAYLQKQAAEESYTLGAQVAQEMIQKLAADLVAVKPIIQELEANNMLTKEEKDSLISALAGADTLTPEVISEATSGLSNADEVAKALLKILEGTTGENVPIEPVTSASATVPAEEPSEADDKMVLEAARKIIMKNKASKKC